MRIKIEKKKQKALELMQQLDIYQPYIEGFKNNNDICMFELFGGFWAYQYPKLMEKIKEIEENYNCLVYAITHEITNMGEFFDFLIIPDFKEDWDYILEEGQSNQYIAMAYVWNVTEPDFSEFGSIGIKSQFGGLARTC